jgi:hypothetical protein
MLSRLPSLYLSSLLLLPGTFDCSDRRERKHSHSTECPKFRLSAQSKVIEPVLEKRLAITHQPNLYLEPKWLRCLSSRPVAKTMFLSVLDFPKCS